MTPITSDRITFTDMTPINYKSSFNDHCHIECCFERSKIELFFEMYKDRFPDTHGNTITYVFDQLFVMGQRGISNSDGTKTVPNKRIFKITFIQKDFNRDDTGVVKPYVTGKVTLKDGPDVLGEKLIEFYVEQTVRVLRVSGQTYCSGLPGPYKYNNEFVVYDNKLCQENKLTKIGKIFEEMMLRSLEFANKKINEEYGEGSFRDPYAEDRETTTVSDMMNLTSQVTKTIFGIGKTLISSLFSNEPR